MLCKLPQPCEGEGDSGETPFSGALGSVGIKGSRPPVPQYCLSLAPARYLLYHESASEFQVPQ